ncbi:hypothetical protein, partial [Massilia sp. Root335]|uniref:hypothetical protein n=1 Tax=Massilia sp. Root335 TaxID=1736517 RepID=UPI001E2CD76D
IQFLLYPSVPPPLRSGSARSPRRGDNENHVITQASTHFPAVPSISIFISYPFVFFIILRLIPLTEGLLHKPLD